MAKQGKEYRQVAKSLKVRGGHFDYPAPQKGETPPDEGGPLLVVTADGQGVPMRRPPQDGPQPHHRHTKGAQSNNLRKLVS